LLWHAINYYTFEEQKQRVERCLKMAQYTVDRFQQFGIDAWRNKNSITVVFPCPSEKVWKSHCLAKSGQYAHVITTAHHLDTCKLDELIADVVADLAETTV
jgi:histidine decarboxylase